MYFTPRAEFSKCLIALLLSLLPAEVLAQSKATLALDNFSVLYFEGAAVGSMMSPTNVPLELTPAGHGEWTLRVRAADFDLPEITYPSGKQVRWKLSSDATGSFSLSGTTLVCQLTAPAVAYVDGAETGIPMTFTFTTESLSASAKGHTAARQGERLDPASGYLQRKRSVTPSFRAPRPRSASFASTRRARWRGGERGAVS
jgi:hypothetical protein